MQKVLNKIMEAVKGLEKRLSALEGKQKTAQKKPKATSKKTEVFYYDITKSNKVNKRNLKSLESSYNYNRERYGKAFKENFKNFSEFKKTLDNLGTISTRDRTYYNEKTFSELNEVKKWKITQFTELLYNSYKGRQP